LILSCVREIAVDFIPCKRREWCWWVGFSEHAPTVSLGHGALPLANHHRPQKLRSQRQPFEFGAGGDPRRWSPANPRRATAGCRAGPANLFLIIINFRTNFRTDGSRPVRRHTFCPNGHKKCAKKAFLLRRACSDAGDRQVLRRCWFPKQRRLRCLILSCVREISVGLISYERRACCC
jgi:hypothetical protein